MSKVDTSDLVAHLQAEYVGLRQEVSELEEDENGVVHSVRRVIDTHPERSAQIREQLAALGADVPTIEGEEA